MVKNISLVGLLGGLLSSAASASPWSNNIWDDNDWPEWTPMYWMEEFFGNDDDDFMKDYYRYRMQGVYSPYSSPYTQFSPYQSPYAMPPFPRANRGFGSMMPMSSFGNGMNPWQMKSLMNDVGPWGSPSSPFSNFGGGFPMQGGVFPMMSPMGMGGMNPMSSSMMSPMGMGMNPMNSMNPMGMSPFSGFTAGQYFPRF
jgi:hypothetical protein